VQARHVIGSLLFSAAILGGTGILALAGPEWSGLNVPGSQSRVLDPLAGKPFPSDASLRRDPGRGTVRFLKGRNLSRDLEQDEAFRALQAADRFAEIALAFLNAYRTEFGLRQPMVEMRVDSVVTDDLGFKQVRLQQTFAGIPVWGAELIVQIDRDNHVNLVQGSYFRTPVRARTTAELASDEALRIAAASLSGIGPECPRCRSKLVIFASDSNPPRLAYRIIAPISLVEGWAVMVDAMTGIILGKVPMVYSRGGS